MNVIVTGGAGFLGSHLVDALLKEGHHVIVIDNMVTGSPENLRQARLEHGQRLQLIEKDVVRITNDIAWKKRYRFDVVFNFACPASPVAYQSDPIQTMLTCVVGTKNMLDIALSDGATFIHASTSEVYGDPEVHPQVESYKGCVNTTGPRACYDEGKRAAETLCFDYNRVHGLPVKVARIFNTYGPRMARNDGRVVSNFIVAALRGETLRVYGSGEQTRSFCYVDDLVSGFLALMRSPKSFTGPVNIGNPEEFTIVQLMSKVFSLVNPDGTCEPVDGESECLQRMGFATLPQDDPQRRRPDITLARTVLGWEPKVGLMEGLARTIEHFRDQL